MEKISVRIIKEKAKKPIKVVFMPLLIGLISAGLFSSVFFALASPPGSKYTPGETLDPSCAPGSTNCTTASPLTAVTGTELDNVFSSSGLLKRTGAGTYTVDTSTYLTSSTGVASITGTANQITASGSTGAITLSLPQSIATTSTPRFGYMGLGTAAVSTQGLTLSLGATTDKGLVVKGASGQSANLQEWQNSVGDILSYIDSGGNINVYHGADVLFQTDNAAGAVNFGGSLTGTTGSARLVDSSGGILDLTNSGEIRWETNLATAPNVAIARSADGVLKIYGGGGATGFGGLIVGSPAADVVGLTVKAIAPQSANLQEWQDSTGNVVASITASGGAVFNEFGAGADFRIEGNTVTDLFATHSVADAVSFNVPGDDATGDIYYRDASGYFTRLGIGSDGYVLTASSGVPVWNGAAVQVGANNNIISAAFTTFPSSSGSDNFLMGYNAGNALTTGSYNNIFGSEAGASTTDGHDNNFLGHTAGNQNTTGSYGNFFGEGAGHENGTGSGNTFIGYRAGYNNTAGFDNVFIGTEAGLNATNTVQQSVLIGYQAGQSEQGWWNNFIGYKAGKGDGSGDGGYNNVMGYEAGLSLSGGANHNVIIGTGAGYYTTSGGYNNFIGYQAGGSNSTGTSNDYFGYNAGLNNNGQGNVFMGTHAGHYQTASDNLLIIDNQDRGDVASEAAGSMLYGAFNATPSLQALTINAGDFRLPYLGTSGSANVYIDNDGRLWKASSSLRYKTNVKPLQDDFAKILEAQPKTYNYKDSGMADLGYIAEEFDAMGLKNLVNYDELGRPDGIKYDKISLYLIPILRQQQADIASLKILAGLNSDGSSGESQAFAGASNSLMDAARDVLSMAGITFQNGVAKIQNLTVNRLTAGVANIQRGIEIKDRATGELYCTWIEGGEWQKQKGACNAVFASLPVNGAGLVGSGLVAGGPENALVPTTQDQIDETNELIRHTISATSQVVAQVKEITQPTEDALTAAKKAQEAATAATEATVNAQKAKGELDQAVTDSHTNSDNATEKTTESPSQENNGEVVAPKVDTQTPSEKKEKPVTPKGGSSSSEGPGTIIEDAAAGIMRGFWNMLRDAYSNSVSSVQSFSSASISSASKNTTSVGINFTSILTEKMAVAGTVISKSSAEIAGFAKLWAAAVSQPFEDMFYSLKTISYK